MFSGLITPGLIIELIVMLLLAVTAGYCFVLNKKLKNLRDSQGELRQVIQDLNQATLRAEGAIKGLRLTAHEAEDRLGESMQKAKIVADQFQALSKSKRSAEENVTQFRKAG